MRVSCNISIAVFALALTIPPRGSAQETHSHPAPEKLGSVSFPTSCNPAVQQEFQRGVALLHSFAYEVSRQAFRDVSASDPKCAMAHWGIAMTYYHQLWEPQITQSDTEKGLSEMQEAKQLGSPLERESMLIGALSTFYADADRVPLRDRAVAYERSMAQVASRFPTDTEAQVFYALSLLATASAMDRTHANQKRAVAVLEPLNQRYPRHPGIVHYLIHAEDNAEMAAQGLEAARSYARIAPSAPHALHMPSHIYTRLGLWQESVSSNLAARAAAHEQGDLGEELHAMDYLVYAYLQMGRHEDADRIRLEVKRMTALPVDTFKIGYAGTAIPVRYAVERNDWAMASVLEPFTDSPPQVQAMVFWSRAVGFAREGKPGSVKLEIDKLQRVFEDLQKTGHTYWAEQVDIQIQEARAWLSRALGKNEEAVQQMRAAADKEDAIEKLPITPGPVIPAREQLGELLLQVGQGGAALNEFERCLAIAPGRRGSVAGALQAATSAHNQTKAEYFRAQFNSLGRTEP
ncbi:hypothetical protein [Edaphobacter bradus]|uniref:hypothetical protein n=1 Tax=Edaphobacter bradus TaxID=2259016 RepID=UPI0021E0642B|nr:hypothetical protein [Edaphobacter bradus]